MDYVSNVGFDIAFGDPNSTADQNNLQEAFNRYSGLTGFSLANPNVFQVQNASIEDLASDLGVDAGGTSNTILELSEVIAQVTDIFSDLAERYDLPPEILEKFGDVLDSFSELLLALTDPEGSGAGRGSGSGNSGSARGTSGRTALNGGETPDPGSNAGDETSSSSSSSEFNRLGSGPEAGAEVETALSALSDAISGLTDVLDTLVATGDAPQGLIEGLTEALASLNEASENLVEAAERGSAQG